MYFRSFHSRSSNGTTFQYVLNNFGIFFQDGVPYRAPNYHASELTVPELITVSCGILFFLAFFMAIYVEVKAKHTVYQLICKFFYMNHEW